jgi:hypothetical protein
MPCSLMNLQQLDEFLFDDTGLCEPNDAAFQAWLDGIDYISSTEQVCSGPCYEAPRPPDCVRADISVVVFGGWNGIPVRAWVGGTEQPVLLTALDSGGRAAVLWTFYPPAGEAWRVSVAPQTPAGKDPARWQYRLLRIEERWSGSVRNSPASADASARRCSEHVFYFQLVDTLAEARR